MARSKETPVAQPRQSAADVIPEWKRQSVERSLQSARVRAQERTDRFVTATIELMQERGNTEFTVQDVVDRSRMSIRTFYNFFASKDDLLVAVHETVLAGEVVPRLRQRVEEQSDPLERVRAYIRGIYDLTANPGPVSRALTTYHNRLAETRPADLDKAFQPQIDLVTELVRGIQEVGRMKSQLSPERAAHLLHHTVVAAVHSRILDSEGRTGITADELYTFCAQGLGVTDAE
jgi:AcrR family transcriptional regulator